MTTTIFAFHPNLKGVSRVNQALAKTAQEAGFDVHDLYALYPDFQIDVAEEQRVLEATDRIVLQFPMYWYSTPALLKEWLDRVLEYGWAYGSQGNALRGKEIILAFSQGAKPEDYTTDGRFHTTTKELLKPLETIQYHTNLVFLPYFAVPGAMSINDEDLVKACQDYLEHLGQK